MIGAALLGSLGERLPAVFDPVGGPDAQRAAREELRKAEYHRDDPSLVNRFFDWLSRRVDVLFSGSAGGSALLVMLVIVAAVVIFAVVRAGPPRRVARSGGLGVDDPLRPLASADHRRLAAELAQQGRHAEALREWLRAAVQTIEDRGILPPRPGRTGTATAHEAGPLLPAAAQDLRTATTAFDEVWFGGRAATRADVAVAQSAADAVASARVTRPGNLATAAGYAQPW